MARKSNSLSCVFWKTLVTILLLFLCSRLAFYFIVSRDTSGTGYLYVTARVLRLLVTVFIGYTIRRRSQEKFACHISLRKKWMGGLLGLIAVSLWLHFHHITPTLYATVSHMLGIYDREATPLFLSVLWEQLFAGGLYWSTLLCLSIVFFTRQPFAKYKNNDKGTGTVRNH